MDPRLPFPVIGLSGGIASGKTHVARLLASLGWAIIDADQAARDGDPAARQLAAELADRLDALIPELEARKASAPSSGPQPDTPKPLQ